MFRRATIASGFRKLLLASAPVLSLTSSVCNAPLTTIASHHLHRPMSTLASLVDTAHVIPSKGEQKRTMIFMHGLGDCGESFIDVMDVFDLPNTKCILPNAPKGPVSWNNGYVMPSKYFPHIIQDSYMILYLYLLSYVWFFIIGWYDIAATRGNDFFAEQDEAGILESSDRLLNLIDEEAKIVGYENIFIGGFSQGAAITTFTGMRCAHKLGGVIALSGYALLHTKANEFVKTKDTPFFFYHGIQDPVVPIQFGRLSQKQYKEVVGLTDITYIEEPNLVHSLSMRELTAIKEWITPKLK